MSQSKSLDQIYEEDVKPVADNLDKDPFIASDLEQFLDYSSGVIGRILTHAAKSPDYEIGRSRTDHISYYSLEEENPVIESQTKAEGIAQGIVEYLEEESESLTENELREEVAEKLEDKGAVVKMRRVGEVKDLLKGKDEINYYPNKSVFELEE